MNIIEGYLGGYCYAEQPQMQVEVILASIGPDNAPIYTIRMRYPRPIHGEIMTHRVFGRNARSSRAVPVLTMLNEVRRIPYVPWHWGQNQKGMQADEECDELVAVPNQGDGWSNMDRVSAWLNARDFAADTAQGFMEAGYHKQNPNRLLEPFSWIDTLITATQWDNFLWLRDHHMAEPHLQDLARLVKHAMMSAPMNALELDEWHLPYITDDDWVAADSFPHGMTTDEFLLNISAARCARISYKPFDGDSSYEKELARYNMLVTMDRVHASPLEHQAKPDIQHIRLTSTLIDGRVIGEQEKVWDQPELHGNLTGYIQARKLVPNEVYPSN